MPDRSKCALLLSGEAKEFIEGLAKRRGISKGQVIQQAITTEVLLQLEMDAGNEILVRNPHTQETSRLLFR